MELLAREYKMHQELEDDYKKIYKKKEYSSILKEYDLV